MAQQVRAVTHLSKDVGSIPGSHVVIYIQSPTIPEPKPLLASRETSHTCITQKTCDQNVHTQELKVKIVHYFLKVTCVCPQGSMDEHFLEIKKNENIGYQYQFNR